MQCSNKLKKIVKQYCSISFSLVYLKIQVEPLSMWVWNYLYWNSRSRIYSLDQISIIYVTFRSRFLSRNVAACLRSTRTVFRLHALHAQIKHWWRCGWWVWDVIFMFGVNEWLLFRFDVVSNLSSSEPIYKLCLVIVGSIIIYAG